MSEAASFVSAAPVLPVRDMKAAIAYYTRVLGFTPAFINGDAGDSPVYAVLARDGVGVHLRPLPTMTHGAGAVLMVERVDALYAEYVAKHAGIARAIEDSSYGLRDFTVNDPDGNNLLFGEKR
jgi:catechol 2,3-dioxygenase-like lactoylglutathione lyase family enzyme